MELRYLRTFVAVADRQNFTRAAEELHIAQPAVSQQIKLLEDELGVSLLARTKRSVELTAAGEAFLHEAREILARLEQAVQTARRAARGETGSLTIGCFSSAVLGFLPGVIQAYRALYPAVRVHLAEMNPEEQLRAFEEGKIDIGFTRPLPCDVAKHFVQERIYSDRLMLLLPEAHRFAKAKSAHLKELAHEGFVLLRRSEAPNLVDQMTQLCAQAGFAPQVVSEPCMAQTLLISVAAGLGVSLMPGCVRVFHQPGVAFLNVEPASPCIDLVMVRRKGEPPPAVAAWLDIVRERVPAIRAQMETGANLDGKRRGKARRKSE